MILLINCTKRNFIYEKIFIKVKIFYLNNKIIKFMWINKKILHKTNFLFNILNKKLALWKF